jgi:hypothetical protein
MSRGCSLSNRVYGFKKKFLGFFGFFRFFGFFLIFLKKSLNTELLNIFLQKLLFFFNFLKMIFGFLDFWGILRIFVDFFGFFEFIWGSLRGFF